MPPVDDVLGDEPITPPVPAGQGKDDYVPLTRAQAESLQRERDESRESEKYWSSLARSGGKAPAAAVEPEAEDASEFLDVEDGDAGLEGDTPEKLVDDFASKGMSALTQRGIPTRAEVKKLIAEGAVRVARELIGREWQKRGVESQIMEEFGDTRSEFGSIKDENSAMFKAASKLYKEAVALDPNGKRTAAELYLAAKAARAQLDRTAPARSRNGEDTDDGREQETDRRQRAASQDARPRSRPATEDHDDMLPREAHEVMKAMGITEAEFKASLKDVGASRPRGRR